MLWYASHTQLQSSEMAVDSVPVSTNLKALRLHGRKNIKVDDVTPQ